jgi:hypothetical protein
MIGHAVKSGKFFYYMCGNTRRRGKGICTVPLLPKVRFENFIVDRVKRFILTEENLRDLVDMFNENMAQNCVGENDRLEVLKAQMEEVDSRLTKLYDALETGEFKGGELAPRIKALFDKKEDLQRARLEAEEALKEHAIELASPIVVKNSMRSLRSLLEDSCITRQKSFLRCFIKRIEVNEENAKIVYTLFPEDPPTEIVGVLPFVHDSPPSITVKNNS